MKNSPGAWKIFFFKFFIQIKELSTQILSNFGILKHLKKNLKDR